MHLRYLRYLIRHKWFVFVAGRRTGAPLWRLIVHDWSKFLPCEWRPYAESFYGTASWLRERKRGGDSLAPSALDYLERAKQEFDAAWLHHQHANAHHWQHWVLREDDGDTKLLPIPTHFVAEMVADWMGAGRAITGKWDVASWYERNRERILLHPDSRSRAEYLIKSRAPYLLSKVA